MVLDKKILYLLIIIFILPIGVYSQEGEELSIPITTTSKKGVSFSASWRPSGAADWHFLSEDPKNEEDEHLIYRDKKRVEHFFGEEGEKEIEVHPRSDYRISNIVWKNQNLIGTIPKPLTELNSFYHLNLSNNKLEEPLPDYVKNFEDLTILILNNNNIKGNIPAEIGEIKNLRELDLSNNNLEEKIPEEIAKLTNLEKLQLHNNKLTGFEELDQENEEERDLTGLKVLTLKNNKLENLPKDIIKFKNLYSLDVKNNLLTSLFDKFAEYDPESEEEKPEMKMNNLEYINASHNRLGCDSSTLPLEIKNLQSLRKLTGYHTRSDWHPRQLSIDLRYNCVSEIPEGIGKLQALSSLKLDHNKIEGFSFLNENEEKTTSMTDSETKIAIPSTIKNLSNEDNYIPFTLLSLHNNELTGEIPEEIGELKKITTIRLQNNNLEGNIPSQLLDLDELVKLNIENNHLNFAPSENENEEETFGSARAEKLKWFFAGRNNISEFPKDLVLPSIEFLYLEENELEELPKDFGNNLSSPTKLTLNKNKLTKLPESFPELIQGVDVTTSPLGFGGYLKYLELGTNNLEEFPEDITELTNLEYLNLSRQSGQVENTGQQIQGQMSGEIPKEITELSALKTFLINNNSLTSFPSEGWGGMSNLKYLYSQNNSINNFPEEMGELSSLERLYINNNEISDSIPAKVVKDTSSLQRFYGQYNDISGQLPSPESNGWNSLERFFADENDISGGLNEKFLKGLNGVEYFSIANNDLNGEINQEIKNMTSLRWFDLANNEDGITGSLPSEIKNLSSLETFDFNNNQLSEVPNQLNEITSLKNIYGFENKITDFASNIEQLNSLVRFDFHNSEEGTNQIPFPEGVEKLSSLKYFSLGENESGEGEVDWEKWTEEGLPENVLSLNNNNLEKSKLADEMLSNINEMVVFNIRDNNFEGGFPKE